MSNKSLETVWQIMKENNFEIKNLISPDLFCSLCGKIMIMACNTPCGCRFCLDCIKLYLDEEDKYCPGQMHYCKEEKLNFDKHIQIDQPINIRISTTIVECPWNSCTFQTTLKTMSDHLLTCEKRPQSCPFDSLGCSEENIEYDQMKEHMINKNVNHVKLLIECIDNLKNEMKYISKELTDLKNEMKTYNSYEVKILNMENNIKFLKEKIVFIETGHSNKLKTDEDQMKENFKNLEEVVHEKSLKVDEIQLKIEQMVKSISSLEMNLDRRYNVKSGFGEFWWYVENWSHKLKEAKELIKTEIISESFYSEKNGYKFCLKLFPTGAGAGKDSHMSIYMCIMRGEFDDKLTWPCKKELVIDLMNQKTGTVHSTGTVKFDSMNISYWEKPKTDKNLGFGYPQFVRIDELKTNVELTQNNQLVIRCVIH